MMLQTGSCHWFPFLLLLFTLHLSPILTYFLKDCTILYSDNVTAGVSVECKNRHLLSIPDDIPREVVSLTLQINDIQRINEKAFDYLLNLRDLELSDNVITHVDDGAFVPLVELTELHMDHNRLTRLTDNMFQGLSNLLILSLRVNNITSINPATFQSLPSLQELSLGSNKIHQMTDIITALQLPHLQRLNISIYELESFQSKDLPLNMSSELRELRITSDSLKTFGITTAVFPQLELIGLTQEYCNDSGWEWIPDKYLLMNLTTVYLFGPCMSFNSIRNALQSLDSLENMHLRYMEKWINRGLLHSACQIPTMRKLYIRLNNIANISETLSPCTRLTYLDLGYNDLTELPNDSIKHMKQLSYLNLGSNQLSKVPDVVNYLPMLQQLSLHHNRIQDLSCSDFLNVTRLTRLNLDSNPISELKPCVFQHLDELKVLTMSDNRIWRFADAFKIGLQKVELLDFSWNQISFIGKGDFTNLKSLKHLVLGSEALFGWNNTALEGLDKLETLSLSFNFVDPRIISSLYLPSLRNLKSLKIQFNQQLFTTNISHITFKNTPNLEALDISNNELKSLDFLAHANLTRLSRLDLSQNELTVIDVSVFSFLPALKYVNMDHNPFTCDCFNADFQQWMLNNDQTQVVRAHQYMCGFPLAKKDTRFLDFDYHSCWVDTSFICFISSTCVIVLTLLASFTYHFLRLHLLYAYYLFLAFLYDAKERKRGSPQRYDAFISYNVHDELWVYREMLPVLEGEQGWRLCLHHRDFPPGKPIIENIADAIYGSRKTICVISHHYLESEWCSREFQMASYRLFDEQKDVLILVFLEDIPAHQLSPYYHMRRLVKRHTYLSWAKAGQHPGLFWQNLRRALDTPHTDRGLNE